MNARSDERLDAHEGLRGKWPNILAHHGVENRNIDGRQRPCPICGGKDRFRFDDRDGEGTWYCNHCGAGDGLTLLMGVLHVDFREALTVARETAGVVGSVKIKPVQSDASKLRRLERTWRAAKPGHPDLLAYLGSRGIPTDLANDPMLRWHPGLSTGDDKASAMLARYFNPGDPWVSCTIQRIWPSLKTKRTMPSPVTMHGAFCPLGGRPLDGILGIGEGIATALAYRTIRRVQGFQDFPVWATYSAGQLEQFIPPDGLKQLHILVDVDYSYTGQAACFALAKRLRLSHPDLETVVEWPKHSKAWDYDFADELKEASP